MTIQKCFTLYLSEIYDVPEYKLKLDKNKKEVAREKENYTIKHSQ